MIKHWWQKYQGWQWRRKQRALQKWSRERLEGKARFLLRNTVLISMIYLSIHEVVGVHVGLGTIAFCHFVGFCVSLYQWADNETKYRIALDASKYQPQINAN